MTTADAPKTPRQGNEPAAPMQRVIKVRRDYNSWVASETMEDYALRFTPQRFRKWSEWRWGPHAVWWVWVLVFLGVGAVGVGG